MSHVIFYGKTHVGLIVFSSILLLVSLISIQYKSESEALWLFLFSSLIIPYLIFPLALVVTIFVLKKYLKRKYDHFVIQTSFLLFTIFYSINILIITNIDSGILESIPIPYLVPWWYLFFIPAIVNSKFWEINNKDTAQSNYWLLALLLFIDIFCKFTYLVNNSLFYVPVDHTLSLDIVTQLVIFTPLILSFVLLIKFYSS